MSKLLQAGLFLGVAALAPALLFAAQIQTWRQESAKDFQAGKLTRLVITSENQVQLSRQVKAFSDVAAAQIWTLASDAKGNLYAATGGPGQLSKIDEAGKSAKLHEDKDAQIFAIAVAADETVYFGTSPGGTIQRVKPDGTVNALFATGETYVWSLAVDGAGNVYAATGPHGKLFVVTPDGKGKVLFQAKQTHLLSMALSPSGICYLGTSADGLVYQVAPDGKASVLFDANQADIQTLLLGKDGTLYAGTGTPARPSLPGTPPSNPTSVTIAQSPPTIPSVGEAAQAVDKDSVAAKAVPQNSSTVDPATSAGAASGMTKPVGGENSIYEIRADGAVDEIFRQKCLILSLAMQNDMLLIGTGQEGRLYQLDPKSRVSGELARLDHGQINALHSRANGSVVVGTGTKGSLYLVENLFAAQGVLLSEVFDAKQQSKWGKAIWTADVPKDSQLEIKFRTGNLAEPDATWSAWMPSAEKLPLARFVQYQAVFSNPDGKSTPTLRDLTLHYASVNRPPRIESIETPNLLKTPSSDPNAKLKFRWKATDPNGDTLAYDVSIRKEGWPAWVRVAEDIDKTEYDWDPAATPGGNYQIQIKASDRPSNRAEEALADVSTSDPFVLDREPPAVKILVVKPQGKRLEVQSSGTDKQTRIVSASYSLDGKPWIPLFPNDGLFDSSDEQVTFQTDDLSPGAHVLVVRYKDSAGHIGTADTVVTVNP